MSPQNTLPVPLRAGSRGKITKVASTKDIPRLEAAKKYSARGPRPTGNFISKNEAAATLPAMKMLAFVSVT